ncbi:DUF5131 family protein [Sinorhizobium meliloti]|nr:DUF5131 family protein [Sinorhizobium meliloti]
MADGTKIEWTDATWNPITGCAVVSPGCTNCYAMKLAGTRLKNHPSRKDLTKDTKAGPVWTGEMRFNRKWLDQPLRWTKPRMIFVCAHGDLFAEGVDEVWIDHVFAVMALAPQHTFQVLTKRPERMREYMLGMLSRRQFISGYGALVWGGDRPDLVYETVDDAIAKPLPNVWLGVSVEDQKRADERIPILLDTPAAVRWISAEPLLGHVDLRNLRRYNPKGAPWIDGLRGLVTRGSYLARSPDECCFNTSVTIPGELPALNWVVAGGESGPGARPMHPDWARSLRDQCGAAGVPFLFKQWGAWLAGDVYAVGDRGGFCRHMDGSENVHTGLPDHWWSGDCFGGMISTRVGKKAAGRLLDGIEHNGFPEVRR